MFTMKIITSNVLFLVSFHTMMYSFEGSTYGVIIYGIC